MAIAEILSRFAAELALFAGVGFLLFAVNDLLVDLIYFARRLWRGMTVYSRYRRTYASYYVFNKDPGFIAILVPAWDEATVIASMLRATLTRLDYDNYRIFVGHYRNDPATAAAIISVGDPRVEIVEVGADGPTTKADCLNHLYDALIAHETANGCAAKAVVLHDAEDVVHHRGHRQVAHRPRPFEHFHRDRRPGRDTKRVGERPRHRQSRVGRRQHATILFDDALQARGPADAGHSHGALAGADAESGGDDPLGFHGQHTGEPRQAKDTIKIAVDAVRRAAPFGDVSRLPRPWKFAETFLFDDARRFKPRTLER